MADRQFESLCVIECIISMSCVNNRQMEKHSQEEAQTEMSSERGSDRETVRREKMQAGENGMKVVSPMFCGPGQI